MKFAKVTKRLMACGLAFALVVSGTGFQSDSASAAKKKKKSSQKKVTVTVGKTKTLKVKKATKKVKWSTSNKKIVKITKQKGKKKSQAVIKGVKKGSAVVTAKFGKTSQKWKVTVKKPATNISSVSVDPLDTSCLVVKLKKAAAVNVSDLTISLKNYNEGTYNYQPTVKTLTTTDQITYRIYLSSGISNGRWVNLKIGKDAKAVQYKKDIEGVDETYLLCERDDTFSISCGNYFSNTIGTVKYSLKEGSLPEGVTLNTKRGILKGIPAATGSYPVTIQATDELGRTGTALLTFLIYDKSVIVSPNRDAEVRLDDYVEARLADPSTITDSTYYKSFEISPRGGSGSYKFTLAAPDVAGVKLSTDKTDSVTGQVTQESASSTYLRIPFGMTEGTHTYTITVTDEVNPAITATTLITINAVKYYNIKGNAKDVNSAPLSGNDLYFIPSDATSFYDYVEGYRFYKNSVIDDDDYYEGEYEGGDGYYSLYSLDRTASVGTSSTDTTIGSQRGTYAAELPAGEYIVKVASDADGIKYQMSTTVQVGAADAMMDVAAPVRFYSVSGIAQYANGSAVTEEYIYFETKDEQYESSGMSFYVKTDATGAFIASLPANNYVAYIYDEKDQRKYFTTEVNVVDTDITLSEFKLPITRYTVSGVARNGDATTESDQILKNTTLYFINPDGDIRTVKTDSTGGYKIALSGAAAPGITYTVKASIDGTQHIIGTITVAEADVSSPVGDLTYHFTEEVKNAVTATIGADCVLTSNGVNALYAKVEIPEDGRYQIRVNAASTVQDFEYTIFNALGGYETYKDSYSSTYVSGTAYLDAGTYYILVSPRTYVSGGYKQIVGNFTLNVSKVETPSYDD